MDKTKLLDIAKRHSGLTDNQLKNLLESSSDPNELFSRWQQAVEKKDREERTILVEERKRRKEQHFTQLSLQSGLNPESTFRSIQLLRGKEADLTNGLEVGKRFAESVIRGRRDSRCLLLLGDWGRGKTMLAAAIANYCLYGSTKSSQTSNSQVVFTQFKELYDKRFLFESQVEVLTRVQNCRLLVIDEVCSDRGLMTNKEKSVFNEFIRYRAENNNLYTVVISNHRNHDELSKAVGVAAFEALKHLCPEICLFSGASKRKPLSSGQVESSKVISNEDSNVSSIFQTVRGAKWDAM